jgi:hypothetical protein
MTETLNPETLRALADGDDQMVWLTELGVPPPVVETMRRAVHAHADAWQEQVRNYVERKHIDVTPNDGLPLRILQAYRVDCDMRWAKTTDGVEDTPLIRALNDLQEQRAEILDRAIAQLRYEEGVK